MQELSQNLKVVLQDVGEGAVLIHLAILLRKVPGWTIYKHFAEAGCDIVIQHEKRNQGIGGRLLRRIEERARDLGCRVVMDHPPVNHPAIGYYLKRGYRICGYNDRFFADSKETTAIFVCKELS